MLCARRYSTVVYCCILYLTGCPGDPTDSALVSTSLGSSTSNSSASLTTQGPSGSDSAGSRGTDSAATGTSQGATSQGATSQGATTQGATTQGGQTSETGSPGPCVVAMCGGEILECGDCIDNDANGDIDEGDVECLGPCDDDESSFATGQSGDNMDPCRQDCFFDGNSGAGDDGCDWNLACDPLNPGGDACPYNPDQVGCDPEQAPECLQNCQVPNGCDCFGCCTVVVDDVEYNIFLNGAECSVETIEQCAMCNPVVSCLNPCDAQDCEICIGGDVVPIGCDAPTCDLGLPSCEVTADCAEFNFCQAGCCLPQPG